MKDCSRCLIKKSKDEFGNNKATRDGLQSQCRDCQQNAKMNRYFQIKKNEPSKNEDLLRRNREAQAKYRQTHPTRVLDRNLKKYGINGADYNDLVKKQEGKCKICKTHESELKKRLHVDHCHTTGKIRGLLCNRCNKCIGQFEEKIELLNSAIDYLK